MANLVKESKYILSNIGNNNNKFWYIELYDDHSTITRNGRVGANGAVHHKSHGSSYNAEKFFNKKCDEKTSKGYRPLNVIGQVNASNVSSVANLHSVARKQIKTNKSTVLQLIDYFTKVNAHNITSATGGQITYNDATGLFSTPLGIVTQENINEANRLLIDIGDLVSNNDYNYRIEGLTNDYMMLVPQDIGRNRLYVKDFWNNLQSVQRQKSIVDSLQASLIQATTVKPDDTNTDEEQVFDVQLDLVEDIALIDRIKKFYQKSINRSHSCSHLNVKKIYTVRIASEEKAFESHGKVLGNIKHLWHGTRASNVLSILKQGLVIPASSSAHCTGRMFGDGLYFSDQSTKSLNYAYGYWKGQRDNNCFMFLSDVAMGKEYVPRGSFRGRCPRGYDSTFAKAHQSGVINNEMIVYETYQANLKYLVEFSK
jgi:poly [ADP-ribose] polymerase